MHTDDHNVPKAGGSLQLKLWADGNKWWSGIPSSTDTYLRVKNIIAYYNTSSSLTNQQWHDKCHKEHKQCKAVMKLDDKKKPEDDKKPTWVPLPFPPYSTTVPGSCIGALPCSTGIGAPRGGSTVTPSSDPTYTGYTTASVTPPHISGTGTSGSDKVIPSMWIIGGVWVGIVVMTLNLV